MKMVRWCRHKGLTLPEVLVLIFLFVIATTILLPWAARIRSPHMRLTCGIKLSGIGKAMLVYGNDYQGRLPRAGGRNSSWATRTPNWTAKDRFDAFALDPNGEGGEATISANLYLLVKYAEVPPKGFLCIDRKGIVEKGMSIFKADRYQLHERELTDLWDFGPSPWLHCSYAYHMLYGTDTLTTWGNHRFAIAADRNPWMDSPPAAAGDFSGFQPDIPPFTGTSEQAHFGNTSSHQEDGQNVMFLDTHVEFKKRPFCGLDDDNIYTSWNGDDKARGVPPKLGSVPADAGDSLLVNDPVGPSK
ncbi:MAG: hypothetical protein ABFD90_00390 [Phycisphaerales bacterium]